MRFTPPPPPIQAYVFDFAQGTCPSTTTKAAYTCYISLATPPDSSIHMEVCFVLSGSGEKRIRCYQSLLTAAYLPPNKGLIICHQGRCRSPPYISNRWLLPLKLAFSATSSNVHGHFKSCPSGNAQNQQMVSCCLEERTIIRNCCHFLTVYPKKKSSCQVFDMSACTN